METHIDKLNGALSGTPYSFEFMETPELLRQVSEELRQLARQIERYRASEQAAAEAHRGALTNLLGFN